MNKMYQMTFVFLVFLLIALTESFNKIDSKARIINKSDLKRPLDNQISAQTGEIVYEDEREFHSDAMDEDMNDQYVPQMQQMQQIHHMPEQMSYGTMAKRYGQSIFGDDFALFLVLLTIAGFFGLIISMLMPFTFLLSNGGVLPLGLGGINGLNGLGGIGGLGGLGGGLGGINGAIIGRRRRSEIYLKKKIIELLSSLDSALDKYRTFI